jgi:hypothetical protein
MDPGSRATRSAGMTAEIASMRTVKYAAAGGRRPGDNIAFARLGARAAGRDSGDRNLPTTAISRPSVGYRTDPAPRAR